MCATACCTNTMSVRCGDNGGRTKDGSWCQNRVCPGQLCHFHKSQGQCTFECCICSETLKAEGTYTDRSHGLALGSSRVLYTLGKHGGGDDSCSTTVVSLGCGHKFCEPCFSSWTLQQRAQGIACSCPLCRARTSSFILTRMCSMAHLHTVAQSRPYDVLTEDGEHVQLTISTEPTLWQVCRHPEFNAQQEYVLWPAYTLHRDKEVVGTMDFYSVCAFLLTKGRVPQLRSMIAVRSDGVPAEWPHYAVFNEASVMGAATRSRMYYTVANVSRFLQISCESEVPSSVHLGYSLNVVKALEACDVEVSDKQMVHYGAKVAQRLLSACKQ